MDRKKYVFGKQVNQEEMTYKIPKKLSVFYQICSHQNPWDMRYYTRRFILNGNNDIVDVKEAHLDEAQYKKLLDKCSINQYKCYSAYNFENIDYPQTGDILALTSNILSSDVDYSGYAQF